MHVSAHARCYFHDTGVFHASHGWNQKNTAFEPLVAEFLTVAKNIPDNSRSADVLGGMMTSLAVEVIAGASAGEGEASSVVVSLFKQSIVSLGAEIDEKTREMEAWALTFSERI